MFGIWPEESRLDGHGDMGILASPNLHLNAADWATDMNPPSSLPPLPPLQLDIFLLFSTTITQSIITLIHAFCAFLQNYSIPKNLSTWVDVDDYISGNGQARLLCKVGYNRIHVCAV
jgi:hypothetical protein